MIKNEKGISIISLVITVLVMLLLTGMLIYNAQSNLAVRDVTDMYNDIELLKGKVSDYYEENGTLPATIQYSNTGKLNGILNDYEKNSTFYVINLEEMKGITLNYGKDYETIKDDSSNANNYTDLYIINSVTQNIFYVEGVTIKSRAGTDTFYTNYEEPDNTKIDLRYIEGVLIPNGFHYIGKTAVEGNSGATTEAMVISNVENEEIDTTKSNQYIWVKYVSTMENLPDNITLDNNTQNSNDFIQSVNFFDGYFKNKDGNVQYSIKPLIRNNQ